MSGGPERSVTCSCGVVVEPNHETVQGIYDGDELIGICYDLRPHFCMDRGWYGTWGVIHEFPDRRGSFIERLLEHQ